jgi:tRNA nucleotidyltransferase (CCA-adding enzyme)
VTAPVNLDLTQVPPAALELCARLREKGKRAWIVGGCVRDVLLGREVNDWDVCTDALPAETMRIFPRAIPTGIDHGTITVMVGAVPYEVTTLRGESGYSDGRRPDEVFFTDDLTADLARRDFTVNAMAVDPTDGKLCDPFDGARDLDAKILRAVGNADERFQEDGLRALRAARFVATLDMELEPATFRAIGEALGTFRKVSAERVRDEWKKTMKAARPSRAFDVMRETGLLGVTCPELLEGWGMEQNKWHAYDVWRHGMECMDACAGDPVLRIAALLHDVGKPRSRAFSDRTQDYTFYEHERIGAEIADPIAQRLKFSNDERQRIVELVRHHLFHYDGWTDAAVRRWLKRVGPERVEDLYKLNEADVRAKGQAGTSPGVAPDLTALTALRAHVEKVLAAGAAFSTRDLAINGKDLMRELALAPGPALGKILAALLEHVQDHPEENTREGLLAVARMLLS